MKNKHIAIAKVGIKNYFNPKNWNYAGGSFDFMSNVMSVIHYNPENQYYFLQLSDVNELSPEEFEFLFPNKNVHFPQLDFNKSIKDDDNEFLLKEWQPFLTNWFKERNIKPDFGMFDFGIYFNTNLIGVIKTERGSYGEYAMPAIIAKRYSMPIIDFVNNNPQMKYITFHFDPRSDLKQRDIFHKPFFMACQTAYDYSYKTWNVEKQDFDMSDYHHEYFSIQEAALFGQDKLPFEEIMKNKIPNKFGIVVNQSKDDRGSIDRYPILRKYVLDNKELDDCEIYGKWDEEITKTDIRFCGIVPKSELNEKIKSWRYSLCIPIGKDWATSKYLEMIINGIVPFLHPYYDTQKNCKLPHDFLFVKDGNDLNKKIAYLEEGNNYEKFIKKLYEYYTSDDFLSGVRLNNRIMKKFDSEYETKNANINMIGFWNKFMKISKDNSMEGFF